MIIMPLGDIFIKEFDITAAQFSILVSAYSFAAFFSSLIGVFYLDIFDRKKALLFIYFGFAIGTFLCSYADSYEWLLGLRIGTGLFGGMISAMVLSIVSDLYLFKERGKAMGMLMGAFSVASALGVPFALYLAAKGDWHTPFFILGLSCIVVCIIVIFTFPNMNEHLKTIDSDRSLSHTLSAITSDRNQLNALLAGFVLVMAHFMIIPFISPYLIKNVGFSQMEITYQFFFGGLATVISSPLIGRAVDKYGVMKVLILTMILSFIPTLIITNLSFVPVSIGVMYTTLFFVLATGRMIAPNTIITAAASQTNRGSFMSFKSALQQLAVALSALISGQIIFINKETDLYENYNIVGYLAIVLGIATLFLVKRIKVAKGN